MDERGFWPYLITGTLFALLGARVAYMMFVKFHRAPAQEQTAVYKVRARKVVRQKFPNFVRAPGLISERNVAEITSHTPATVLEIAQPGTVLQPGDVIARLVPIDGKSKEQLLLKVRHAQQKLETEYSASRNQVVAKNPGRAESEIALLVERISSVRKAQEEYAKAEEELKAHESQTIIKATHYCKVDTVAVYEGASVSHNTKLCAVTRLDSNDVFVDCWVPHNMQSQIHKGQKASFSFSVLGGVRVIPGKVESVGVSSKNTLYHGACITIRLDVPQKHEQSVRLYPPKTPGDACIFVEDKEMLSVPEAALDPMKSDVIPGSTNTVLKIDKISGANATLIKPRGFAYFVPVTIVSRRYGFVAISVEGGQLKDGDSVSIDSILNLEARSQGKIPVEVIEEGDRASDYAYEDDSTDAEYSDSKAGSHEDSEDSDEVSR